MPTSAQGLTADQALGQLPAALRDEAGSAADLILRGGDQLIVPRIPQEVTVIGEVQKRRRCGPLLSHEQQRGLGRA